MSFVGVRSWGALTLIALVATACSEEPELVYPPEPAATAAPTEYDPTLEPSAAVLSLVPADATRLTVTDYDQLRLTLGFGTFDRRTPPAERARFWSAAGRAATLADPILGPVDERLRSAYGFGRDDVAWQATYSGGAEDGWVIAFREGVPMGTVARAVQAGVGPLRGAVVDEANGLVMSADAPEGEVSWAAEASLHALVGRQANATYVERGCVPFETVFGTGEDDLATAPRAALEELDPLESYAVAFGAELVTVQLGPARRDAFDRLRLAEVMPQLRPEFGTAFARGVADPSSGRLGYELADPVSAVELTLDRHLPFAVCAD